MPGAHPSAPLDLSAFDDLEPAPSPSRIDFRRTVSLLSHGDDVLADISQASRRLLADVGVGEAGDVGKIAAAVLDGVKILRIEDLQSQANAVPAERPKGLVQKLLRTFSEAQDAYKGFQENRRRFLDLMDSEQAKARRSKADLTVAIDLLEATIRSAATEIPTLMSIAVLIGINLFSSGLRRRRAWIAAFRDRCGPRRSRRWRWAHR